MSSILDQMGICVHSTAIEEKHMVVSYGGNGYSVLFGQNGVKKSGDG